MKSGIYTITSPSGKRYVGSSFDCAMRWGGHRYHLRRNKHHSAALQSAWNKYGEEAMVFEKVLSCAVDNLLHYEQILMDAIKPEYNIAPFAGSNRGWRHSEDAKRRIGAAARRPQTEEGKRRLSEARMGMKFTPEHRANISKATKGKTKRQPPGQTRSPERRAAIGAAMRGVPKSPQAKANMLVARHARMALERTVEHQVKTHMARLEWILGA